MDEIKFPFEPNETVKAAFRQQSAMKRAVELITAALVETASEIKDPWMVLMKEYPQLEEDKRQVGKLKYNSITQMIDLAP